MHAQRYEAAILDMDGVVTRTADLHARAWKEMFDAYLADRGRREGRSYEPFDIVSDYRNYVDGKPRYDGVKSFLQSRGIELPWGQKSDRPDQETVCGLGNRKNELFQEILQRDGVKVYDDTVEQVHRWKRQGWKVAVISSSRNCETILKAANVLDLFDLKLDGNDIARLGIAGKPAPDIFLLAAEQLGVEPRRVVGVEDALSGIEALIAGGFGLVVGVARAGNADQLRRHGAHRTVSDLRELETLDDDPPRGDSARKGGEQPLPALEQGEWFARHLQNRDLALFLDYDGTLTPIVRRPEEAILSDATASVLRQLARQCTVAIVSGRDRANAEAMVNVPGLVYAGSHGFDIRGPGGLEMQHEEAKRALPDLDAAEQELTARLSEIIGARVERKRFAIAAHYRELADPADAARVEAAVDRTLAEHRGLRKKGGKKIFELQPDVPWDKGRAVLWLAEALGLDPARVLTVYIGDDVTDEDAFRALRDREGGVGVRVGDAPAQTHARYYLRDCDEVQQFLGMLLDLLARREERDA